MPTAELILPGFGPGSSGRINQTGYNSSHAPHAYLIYRVREMAQTKNRFGILFLLPFVFLLNGCGGSEAQVVASRGGAGNLPARQVKLAKSEARRLAQTVTAPGTLAAD